MDAATSGGFEKLAKSLLPRLVEQLQLLNAIPAGDRSSDVDLVQLIAEVQDLLNLVADWAGHEADGETVENSATAAPAATGAGTTMSDDEARKLLEMMDAPVNAGPASAAAPATSAAAKDMSDDEARRLLAEMDAPVAASSAKGDMSDDEARRLLADMDAPAPKPVAAPAPTPAAPATAATPVAGSAAPDAHGSDGHEDHDDADVGEIPEWDSNQFASDPDMLNDFLTNSAELMETLDQTILALEQNPEGKETIEAIFRAAHTLKGAAGMFGFKGIERVMHRMENLFDLVRKGKLVPTADTIDVVFQGIDVLRKLLEAVKVGKPSGVLTAPVVRAISLAALGKYVKGAVVKASAAPASTPASAAASGTPTRVEPVKEAAKSSGNEGSKDAGKDTKAKAPAKDQASSTIRVDIERLDALVNLVGELVIDRTRFSAIEGDLRTEAPQLKLVGNMTETVQLFGRHMNEIQDIIMKVRMVPIGNTFNKFPRIVRDLARQLDKQMELVIEGEGTELDKTLVEQIGDPLVHLIRNACDHGIETPDVRVAAGKNPAGRILLSARQEGNAIIISIKDDGKGMDVERIRAKGIERGLISADQTLSDREILNLIFEAGFSTADKVTTVSGRGVGMDVVRKQIAKLKGMVEISSQLGKGSTITIQLPLTLAIVQSLLVGSRNETFAIPLSSVVESIRIKPSEIQRVGDAEVIKLRDHVLPLVHLDTTLDLDRRDADIWYSTEKASTKGASDKNAQRRLDRLFVVVVGAASSRFGIVVDRLLNQQEMVIKPIGRLLKGTPCVAGGAVMGNGKVVLVLDVPEIEEHFRQKMRNVGRAA